MEVDRSTMAVQHVGVASTIAKAIKQIKTNHTNQDTQMEVDRSTMAVQDLKENRFLAFEPTFAVATTPTIA